MCFFHYAIQTTTSTSGKAPLTVGKLREDVLAVNEGRVKKARRMPEPHGVQFLAGTKVTYIEKGKAYTPAKEDWLCDWKIGKPISHGVPKSSGGDGLSGIGHQTP